ncbi:hypothetical protein Pan216_54150 [Planctomycetes bacterium Pan216]|uniref:Uncharacterized protein n=1 Tax=Kolteria novifilia TaxID=2527975 RepID=A0A518BC12_9BACT|nr:hypothetical protein Pan216_54150 [Planctomycetes bacterium Pan216]
MTTPPQGYPRLIQPGPTQSVGSLEENRRPRERIRLDRRPSLAQEAVGKMSINRPMVASSETSCGCAAPVAKQPVLAGSW